MTTDERFEKLERELGAVRRRYRLVTLGMTACLALMVAGGTLGLTASPADGQTRVPNEIRARAFVVVDESGEERAILTSSAYGPSLKLLDASGKPRAVLCSFADGPALMLTDENGKLRAMLSLSTDGPSLKLTDENSKPRAMLSSSADGPSLMMTDESGAPRAVLSSSVYDGPELDLFDARGQRLPLR